jgi:DNA sulfur modification protein DndB
MGGHTYYTFVLSPDDLLKIAYVHHRSGQSSFLELSDSYQRIINAARVRKIAQFIEEENGFFPGSIILNFHRNFTKKETLGDKRHLDQITNKVKPVVLTLPPYYGCAWIIDGQHRLYGYADLHKKHKETIPVVAFVDESNSLEAKMFVDVNKNQKSIEANLLWDLYEDLYVTTKDEKEKQLFAISKIAKELNRRETSPFYGHISIPKDQNLGNITLTTICTMLKQQKLIDPNEDLLFKKNYDETVDFAVERISVFFNIFKEFMPNEWNAGDKHYIRTNSGIVVLLGIFRDIFEGYLTKTEITSLEKFRKTTTDFLEPLIYHFEHADPTVINGYRGAGGAGQKSRQVRYELTKVIRDANVGFRSIWLEKYEQALSEENKFAKRRKGVLHYLDNEEGDELEFKGSLSLNLNRYFKGDGILQEDPSVIDDGALKTIVAFLNSKGGDLIIGVLEKNKFEDVYDEKLSTYPLHNEKIIYGIESEYKKDEWDGYLQKLTSLIENRIGADVIDSEYITIERLKHEERELCHVSVYPSDSKQYLTNKFFIRRTNKTVQLEGTDIDKYWQSRRS